MKIDRLDIPEGYRGLRKSSLVNLSDVVLLAGPNGGGKSRVLQAVLENCDRMTPTPPGQQRRDLANRRDELAAAEASLEKADSSHNAVQPEWRSRVEELRRSVKILEDRMLGIPVIDPDILPAPLVVDLTTANVNFSDATTVSGWEAAQAQIEQRLDLGAAMQFGPSAVYALLANAVAATSTTSDMNDLDRAEFSKRLEALNQLTESILGTQFKIGQMQNGPMLFDQKLGDAKLLSSGQRMLLAVTYLLFFQESTDKDVILLWDEPENHLHPKAVISILESLRSACPKAQMWIATHSVHILAHFQEHGIWFAREGEVTRGGKVAEKVLGSLLGDESQLNRLAEFLALPAQRALRLFAGQCLVEPGAVDTLPGDPQTTQIYEILAGSKGGPMKVLDFGAGKGRLLSELTSHDGAMSFIDYFAYDFKPSSIDQAAVKSYLSAAYGESSSRYVVGKANEVLKPWCAEFDVVVLCNALHEIPPEDWSELFGPQGAIVNALKEDGNLMIVEDYELAAGERAHRFGFLLLGESELSVLFNARAGEITTLFHEKEAYRDRLKVHVVPKRVLARMCQNTILLSLEALRDRAYREARQRHSGDLNTPKAGHALAVAAHQHLNALLALEALQHEGTVSDKDKLKECAAAC